MKRITQEKGSALLISLALIMALSAVAMVAIDRSTDDVELSFNQLHHEQAFYLAEAGYEHAIRKMIEDKSWRDGIVDQALGTGTYTVTVVDATADSSLADTVLIVSTGKIDKSVATVGAWLVPGEINPFSYALFSDGNLAIRQDACTDSYRSDSGTYLATVLQEQGDIGSNALIILSQGATAGGDASTAIPGGISIGPSAVVLGNSNTGVPPVKLDIIPQSEYDSVRALNDNFSGLSGSGFTYTTSTHKLSVNQNGYVNLASGTYYFSAISLKQNARLTISPGATATVYATGNISLQQNATANDGGSPANLIIYSQGAQFSMFQDSKFYGAFYGPNVTFKGRQDMGMYGSVVAGGVTIFQDGCFHYDRTLKSFRKAGSGEVDVVAWKEL